MSDFIDAFLHDLKKAKSNQEYKQWGLSTPEEKSTFDELWHLTNKHQKLSESFYIQKEYLPTLRRLSSEKRDEFIEKTIADIVKDKQPELLRYYLGMEALRICLQTTDIQSHTLPFLQAESLSKKLGQAVDRPDLQFIPGLQALAEYYAEEISDVCNNRIIELISLIQECIATARHFCQTDPLLDDSNPKYLVDIETQDIVLGELDPTGTNTTERERLRKEKRPLIQLWASGKPLLVRLVPSWFVYWWMCKEVWGGKSPYQDLSTQQKSPLFQRLLEPPAKGEYTFSSDARTQMLQAICKHLQQSLNKRKVESKTSWEKSKQDEYSLDFFHTNIYAHDFFLRLSSEFRRRFDIQLKNGVHWPEEKEIKEAILHPLQDIEKYPLDRDGFYNVLFYGQIFGEVLTKQEEYALYLWNNEEFSTSNIRGLVRYMGIMLWHPELVPSPESVLLQLMLDKQNKAKQAPKSDKQVPTSDQKWFRNDERMLEQQNPSEAMEDFSNFWYNSLGTIYLVAAKFLWEFCDPKILRDMWLNYTPTQLKGINKNRLNCLQTIIDGLTCTPEEHFINWIQEIQSSKNPHLSEHENTSAIIDVAKRISNQHSSFQYVFQHQQDSPILFKLFSLAQDRSQKIRSQENMWEQVSTETLVTLARLAISESGGERPRIPQRVYKKLPADLSFTLYFKEATYLVNNSWVPKAPDSLFVWWTEEHTQLLIAVLEKMETGWPDVKNQPHAKEYRNNFHVYLDYLRLCPSGYKSWMLSNLIRACWFLEIEDIANEYTLEAEFDKMVEVFPSPEDLEYWADLFAPFSEIENIWYNKPVFYKVQIASLLKRHPFLSVLHPNDILFCLVQKQSWAVKRVHVLLENKTQAELYAKRVCLESLLHPQHVAASLIAKSREILNDTSYYQHLFLSALIKLLNISKEDNQLNDRDYLRKACVSLEQELHQIELLSELSLSSRIQQIIQLSEQMDVWLDSTTLDRPVWFFADLFEASMMAFSTLDLIKAQDKEEKRLPKLIEAAMCMWILGYDFPIAIAAEYLYDKQLIPANREVGGQKRHEPLSVMLTSVITELLRMPFSKWPLPGVEPFSPAHRRFLLVVLGELATSKAIRVLHDEKKFSYRRKEYELEKFADLAVEAAKRRSRELAPRRRFDRVGAVLRYVNRERRNQTISRRDRELTIELVKSFKE